MVEECQCASQFSMVRVSEGKYRIGDTKILIFVRVGGNTAMLRFKLYGGRRSCFELLKLVTVLTLVTVETVKTVERVVTLVTVVTVVTNNFFHSK